MTERLLVPRLQVNNRKYPKLKEVDDVLGGAAAWENVDSTPGKCLSECSSVWSRDIRLKM